jgi:hypothetical protein
MPRQSITFSNMRLCGEGTQIDSQLGHPRLHGPWDLEADKVRVRLTVAKIGARGTLRDIDGGELACPVCHIESFEAVEGMAATPRCVVRVRNAHGLHWQSARVQQVRTWHHLAKRTGARNTRRLEPKSYERPIVLMRQARSKLYGTA